MQAYQSMTLFEEDTPPRGRKKNGWVALYMYRYIRHIHPAYFYISPRKVSISEQITLTYRRGERKRAGVLSHFPAQKNNSRENIPGSATVPAAQFPFWRGESVALWVFPIFLRAVMKCYRPFFLRSGSRLRPHMAHQISTEVHFSRSSSSRTA